MGKYPDCDSQCIDIGYLPECNSLLKKKQKYFMFAKLFKTFCKAFVILL